MGLFDMFKTKSTVETNVKCLAHYETNLNDVKNKKCQDILRIMGQDEQLIVEKLNINDGLCLVVKNFNNETLGTISNNIVKEIEQNYNNFEAKIEWYKIYNNVDAKYECCVCLKIF